MKFYARLRRQPRLLPATLTLAIALLAGTTMPAAAADIVELEITDGIGVATAEYLISGIEHAKKSTPNW